MDNQEEGFYYLADVRGGENQKNGKLLFRLAVGEYGITILLKTKGEDKVYCIPIYILLQPFNSDEEELKRCTRMAEYWNRNQEEKNI